ncbi:MAG: V-type ATP synthase subunit I [Chloroflexi bacterium]|nr:V-type ATP synthase subunit I [Chloroflexota bacterium]
MDKHAAIAPLQSDSPHVLEVIRRREAEAKRRLAAERELAEAALAEAERAARGRRRDPPTCGAKPSGGRRRAGSPGGHREALMRLRMSRLQIVGLKTHLEAAVHALHCLGCVQIEDLSEAGDVSARPLHLDRDMVRTQEELGYLTARIEGLLAALVADGRRPGSPAQMPHAAGGSPGEDCLTEARAGLETLGPQAQALVSKRGSLEAEQASLPRYEATLRKLLPIVPLSARDPANVSFGLLVSRTHLGVLDAVAERVVNLTGGRAEVVAEDVDSATRAMLIVIPDDFAIEVETLLGREDISRLRLPSDFANQPPDRAVAALSQRLAAIPQELAQVKSALSALAEVWEPRLACWRICLRQRLEEFAVLSRFGETDQTFVLVGWTPERDLPRVREALTAVVGDAAVMQALPPTRADEKRAPVALVNPGPARPFQSLVRLLAVPRYEGIDPTMLMAVFLPIFFGMILGDVAYGALLLLFSFILLRRFRTPGIARDILHVLLLGSAWGIAFGFLYGEAFGTLGEHFGLHALWLDRTSPRQVTGLLLFSVAVGAVHITLGLILGVWEAFRQRSRNHLLERGGMLVGLIGLFLVVSVAVKWLPAGFMTPGVAAMIVGIALLGASLGWLGLLMGPIEFVGLVGNILSYLRLAAIGLASVYLARVANDLAGNLGNIVAGVIIAVFIHALNLVLGAFSPTIHSLRLHYVEFFRKFYEGGGRPFEPFGSEL